MEKLELLNKSIDVLGEVETKSRERYLKVIDAIANIKLYANKSDIKDEVLNLFQQLAKEYKSIGEEVKDLKAECLNYKDIISETNKLPQEQESRFNDIVREVDTAKVVLDRYLDGADDIENIRDAVIQNDGRKGQDINKMLYRMNNTQNTYSTKKNERRIKKETDNKLLEARRRNNEKKNKR